MLQQLHKRRRSVRGCSPPPCPPPPARASARYPPRSTVPPGAMAWTCRAAHLETVQAQPQTRQIGVYKQTLVKITPVRPPKKTGRFSGTINLEPNSCGYQRNTVPTAHVTKRGLDKRWVGRGDTYSIKEGRRPWGIVAEGGDGGPSPILSCRQGIPWDQSRDEARHRTRRPPCTIGVGRRLARTRRPLGWAGPTCSVALGRHTYHWFAGPWRALFELGGMGRCCFGATPGNSRLVLIASASDGRQKNGPLGRAETYNSGPGPGAVPNNGGVSHTRTTPEAVQRP